MDLSNEFLLDEGHRVPGIETDYTRIPRGQGGERRRFGRNGRRSGRVRTQWFRGRGRNQTNDVVEEIIIDSGVVGSEDCSAFAGADNPVLGENAPTRGTNDRGNRRGRPRWRNRERGHRGRGGIQDGSFTPTSTHDGDVQSETFGTFQEVSDRGGNSYGRHNGGEGGQRRFRERNRARGRGNPYNANFSLVFSNTGEDGVSSGSFARVGQPGQGAQVDANALLHYLVNNHNGVCLISDLKESNLFSRDANSDIVMQSIRQCRNLRVLVNYRIDASIVKVVMYSLRLCFRHRPPDPCQSDGCRYIHLCRAFAMDCCYAPHCVCEHDVRSPHNMNIMVECGAQIFSAQQILEIIRSSNLMVCRKYNDSPRNCESPESCSRLHICSAFVVGRCLIPNDECPEGHNLMTESNRKVLRMHNMEHFQEEMLFKLLLVFRKKPQPIERRAADSGNNLGEQLAVTRISELDRNSATEDTSHLRVSETSEQNRQPQPVSGRTTSSNDYVQNLQNVESDNNDVHPLQNRSQRKENIVSFSAFLQQRYNLTTPDVDVDSQDSRGTFEAHDCTLKIDCTDRHGCKTPYLWRVKLEGQWFNLENKEIEQAFCDPDRDQCWDVESIAGHAICLNFAEMSSNVGPIQRLSTHSYVENRDRGDSTIWIWYFHDDQRPEKWIPYKRGSDPPLQDVLEQKYLFDPTLICCFENGRFYYELDFSKMEQKNLQTRTVRKVKRRPLQASQRHYSTEYHCDLDKLPPGWVPMDTESKNGTELVPLHSRGAIYTGIKKMFFSTMNKDHHKIRRIYRLQNLDLWTSYQTTKARIDKNMGAETEKSVFHGTAQEETTRWICGVGFDQRMHGVNGTAYGKGVYFATTAEYSHNYTQPSKRNLRYMFYAKITLGEVALGKSEYKRPPPIDPKNPKKGLYDSCVNSKSNPGIYVIFDNSQTYPAYLIEYKDAPALPAQVPSYPSISASQQAYPVANRNYVSPALHTPAAVVSTNRVSSNNPISSGTMSFSNVQRPSSNQVSSNIPRPSNNQVSSNIPRPSNNQVSSNIPMSAYRRSSPSPPPAHRSYSPTPSNASTSSYYSVSSTIQGSSNRSSNNSSFSSNPSASSNPSSSSQPSTPAAPPKGSSCNVM